MIQEKKKLSRHNIRVFSNTRSTKNVSTDNLLDFVLKRKKISVVFLFITTINSNFMSK